VQLSEQRDCLADTFQSGMLVGKLIALGWVTGEPSAALSIQYDFEGRCRAVDDAEEA
jgi:hypothetical protein